MWLWLTNDNLLLFSVSSLVWSNQLPPMMWYIWSEADHSGTNRASDGARCTRAAHTPCKINRSVILLFWPWSISWVVHIGYNIISCLFQAELSQLEEDWQNHCQTVNYCGCWKLALLLIVIGRTGPICAEVHSMIIEGLKKIGASGLGRLSAEVLVKQN